MQEVNAAEILRDVILKSHSSRLTVSITVDNRLLTLVEATVYWYYLAINVSNMLPFVGTVGKDFCLLSACHLKILGE